jgi:hypothetical protein
VLLQRTAPGHRLDRTSLIFTPVIKYKLRKPPRRGSIYNSVLWLETWEKLRQGEH